MKICYFCSNENIKFININWINVEHIVENRIELIWIHLAIQLLFLVK